MTAPIDFAELERRLHEHLDQGHRYEHSLRVAACAVELAQRHGVDAEKARLAGLLHDLARLYSAEQLILEAEARAMPVSPFEREKPTLLHAAVGAALARERFGVDDPAVLSAIAKHTRGAAEMSPLDCVVYLADSLEPARTFAERAELWEYALRDLAGATRETMRRSEEHHARKRTPAEARVSAS
jgi:predicted HD superfamily hydrolase involved in NAD metabolism